MKDPQINTPPRNRDSSPTMVSPSSATATATVCLWDALPVQVSEHILSLLPLTALLPVAAVSRDLRRLVRSPAFHGLLSPHRLDAFFLLSPCLAFHPFSRRILPVPPTPPLDSSSPAPPLISSSSPSLLITAASLARLPPLHPNAYLLAVVAIATGDYTLVAITAGADTRSYTLDSTDPSPRWTPRGNLPLPFALLGNAAVDGGRGRLFVLGRGPDALLLFDLATGQWEVLPVVMPQGLTTAHLLIFRGRLFLVGGVERFGMVERIAVWWFHDDDDVLEFREVGTMPVDVFDELVAGRHGSFWHFQAADRMGIVCLCNAVDGRLVMFDVADGSWMILPRVLGLDAEECRRWFGHVVEPRIELLL